MRALLALLAAAAVGAAEFALTVTPGGDLVVETSIAGQACLALVDTGASHSVLDRGFVQAQRIRTRRVKGTTRTVDAVTQGVDLVDQDLAISGPGVGWRSFTVIDLGLANRGAERPVVAILGLDWLRDAQAVIDLPALRLRTREPAAVE